MPKKYSDDDLTRHLRECYDKYGTCSPNVFRDHRDEHGWASPSTIIERFDGSWTNAKEAAGIDEETTPGQEPQYRDEVVLSKMRRIYEEHGKCTITLMNEEEDGPSAHVAINRWGSWSEAKKAAEIKEESRNVGRTRSYSDEDYLELMEEFYEEHGKLTQRLWDDVAEEKEDFPTAGAIMKRFRNRHPDKGGWSAAKEAAGIPDDSKPGADSEYVDEELLEMLQECNQYYNGCSARKFTNDERWVSSHIIQKRFLSWNVGKYFAGVLDDDDLGEDELLNLLRYCDKQHGKVTKDVFENDSRLPSVELVEEFFGTWNGAKYFAGVLDEGQLRGEDIIHILQYCEDKHGKVTKDVFTDDPMFPPVSTVESQFGTWRDAKKAASVGRHAQTA